MDLEYGVSGILVLILDIWAILKILQSSASNGERVLWILLIIVLPLIGFVIWLSAGPGSRRVRVSSSRNEQARHAVRCHAGACEPGSKNGGWRFDPDVQVAYNAVRTRASSGSFNG